MKKRSYDVENILLSMKFWFYLMIFIAAIGVLIYWAIKDAKSRPKAHTAMFAFGLPPDLVPHPIIPEPPKEPKIV